MIPQNHKIDGEYIAISRYELESLRDNYWELSQANKDDEFRRAYYIGKATVCIDLLKMFEPLIAE